VPLDRMLGALLRIPAQAIVEHIARALAANGHADLRPAHFSVFQHLPAGGARLTEVAERAQITKQSMGALVIYLEAAGYLERSPDPTDRRAQIIRRTEQGWEVERIARAALRELEEEWSERLGRERMQQCRAFLEDLAAEIEREAS
jgi:DNA-binding MarR family transcriptional regulator